MRFARDVRRSRALAVVVMAGVLVGAACADDGPPAALPTPIAPATMSPAPDPPGDAATVDPLDATPDDEAGAAGSDAAEPGPVVPVATVTVQSLDNIFRPEIIEVEVGTEVVWVNAGRTDHDVTPADPSAAWGVAADGFQPGDEYRFVFTEPGTYDYFCSIHGTATVGQIGTVVVRDPT